MRRDREQNFEALKEVENEQEIRHARRRRVRDTIRQNSQLRLDMWCR